MTVEALSGKAQYASVLSSKKRQKFRTFNQNYPSNALDDDVYNMIILMVGRHLIVGAHWHIEG